MVLVAVGFGVTTASSPTNRAMIAHCREQDKYSYDVKSYILVFLFCRKTKIVVRMYFPIILSVDLVKQRILGYFS